MTVLVPIVFEHIEQTLPVWSPFIQSIAETGGYEPDQLLDRVFSGEVQPIVVWDVEEQKAVAFLGLRLFARGKDTIGEIIWCTGEGKDAWTHLLPDLEAHALRLGCRGMRMFARRGWKPFLSKSGYRESHVILDREF